MTTYRRFCCNDLLRLGSLRTNSGTQSHPMPYYMYHLAASPGNCIVADTPGGRIAGCVLGLVVAEGEARLGWVTTYAILHKELIILLMGRMLKLMGDSCRKIYKAYTMKIYLGNDHFHAQQILQELGYGVHREDEQGIEMRKCLRSISLKREFYRDRIRMDHIRDRDRIHIDRIVSHGLGNSVDLSRRLSMSPEEEELDRLCIDFCNEFTTPTIPGLILRSPLDDELYRIETNRDASSSHSHSR